MVSQVLFAYGMRTLRNGVRTSPRCSRGESIVPCLRPFGLGYSRRASSFLSCHSLLPQRSRGGLESSVVSRLSYQQCRTLSTGIVPSFLVPPAVFVGLVAVLWFYKCCMMVLFQNKIIYMPSVPPFSRSEKIADYARTCAPAEWREQRIRSLDGTEIALCVGSVRGTRQKVEEMGGTRAKGIVVVYFQG